MDESFEAAMEVIKLALEDVTHAPKNDVDVDTVATAVSHQHSKLEEPVQNQSTYENVSVLDLTGKSLTSLALGLCNQLHTLDISNNKFEILPDDLQGLHSLTRLSVSQNKLKELPQWIGTLRNIVTLNLASNNLQSLPSSFSNLNLLKELDLSHNQFFKVPDSIQVGCISLQNLDLSYNFIGNWLLPPASVSTLQSLCLSHNSIASIPPWLCDGKAMSLKSLNLSKNPVFYLEQKLSNKNHKSGLRKLTLSHCYISENDLEFIGQFKSIIHFDLSNNLFIGNNIADNIVRVINLSTLQFRNCLIELLLRGISLLDLPKDIEELVSLQVLDCRDNSLLLLPDSICNLPQLRICLLSNNSLCVLPDKIGDLTSLRELRLERNNITYLPESIGNLENLCWLDLYGNLISEVPNQFGKIIENLQGLDFECNYVSLCSDLEDTDDKVWLPSNKYQSLMDNMRSYHVCVGGNGVIGISTDIRATGCRSPPVEDEECSSGESSCERSYSNKDGDSENDEKISSPGGSEEEEEERWDTATSESDDFDPNYHACLPKPTKEERQVVTIPYHLTQRYKFCPSDMHTTRIKENVSGITYAPEEGQFDDA